MICRGSTVWTSDANANMQLNGVYKLTKNGWAMQGYCYHFTCFGPDGYDYFRNSNIEMGTATTRDGIFLSAYVEYYKVINAANDAIANLTDNPNITPELRERMIGEARFLRGFSYFMLWQLYGGVIILDKPTQPTDTYLPRNTADHVRDFVIEVSKMQLNVCHWNMVILKTVELRKVQQSQCWGVPIFTISVGEMQLWNCTS